MLSERVVKYLIRNEYMKWLDSNIHQKNDDKIVFFHGFRKINQNY